MPDIKISALTAAEALDGAEQVPIAQDGATRQATLQAIIDLVASEAFSPAQILAALITVDGPGSGLNADKLDGYESAEFETAGAWTLARDRDTHTGTQLAATISDFDDAAVAAGSGTYATVADVLAAGKGFVVHGAVAGTARPTGFASVEWFGSVEPTNAVDDDTWVVTT